MNHSAENLWQTKQFAELSKVPVRTLHHYDRIGILKPKHYDKHGFRLYGTGEFARLQQISTLKFIGFSLAQIKAILIEREFDLSETLQLQRKIIESQRNRLNLALEAVIADGAKPLDSRAQTLANRWRGLLTQFTGGDAQIQEGLNKMYADEKNWRTEWKKLFSDEVQNFISELDPSFLLLSRFCKIGRIFY